MKQDIQRIMLAAAKPLFLIFILYILKIMEVGMDWDFSRLGGISYGETGTDRHFNPSADTQWIQSFIGKYNPFILLVMVSFLLLPGNSW